jgi:hypothetical protein
MSVFFIFQIRRILRLYKKFVKTSNGCNVPGVAKLLRWTPCSKDNKVQDKDFQLLDLLR